MEFTLRKWKLRDAPSIAKYANNPNIANNLRNAFPYPYTLADAWAYISFCIDNEKIGRYCRAIEINGEAVGSIGVFQQLDIYKNCGELGYWLGEPYWGNGIMYQAITMLCDYVFDTTEITRIYAEPFARNTGSRHVLEKAGFTLEGIMRQGAVKNGIYEDWCMYRLLKEERKNHDESGTGTGISL